jgi:hypothetical protein
VVAREMMKPANETTGCSSVVTPEC